MSRALQRYFGVEPDLDIEAQRAIVALQRPMSIDWKIVAERIRRANYTFGGAHLRARGTILALAQPERQLLLELDGSGQRFVLANPERAQDLENRRVEVVARVENWQSDSPRLVLQALGELTVEGPRQRLPGPRPP